MKFSITIHLKEVQFENNISNCSYGKQSKSCITLIMLTPDPILTRRYGNKSLWSICTNSFWPSICVKASCRIAWSDTISTWIKYFILCRGNRRREVAGGLEETRNSCRISAYKLAETNLQQKISSSYKTIHFIFLIKTNPKPLSEDICKFICPATCGLSMKVQLVKKLTYTKINSQNVHNLSTNQQ